jgi:hypothetical protein
MVEARPTAIDSGARTMSFNTEDIVQNIRSEFEIMLQGVQESDGRTADQMERSLFKQLLYLGAQMMLLFFQLRAAQVERTPRETETGELLPYHGETKRNYYSIFGKLAVVRSYFYASGLPGVSPLDQELSLGDDCYSDLVREIATYLGVDVTYAKVGQFFQRLLGQSLSTQAVSTMVHTDAGDVERYYEQKAAPAVADEAAILVVQADGKGVPMVRQTPTVTKTRLGKGEKRSKKKEAIVTTCYTIAPRIRTPEDVVASFFHPDEGQRPRPDQRIRPQNKHIWATLDGKDAALERLANQAQKRKGEHIKHRVALTDGCAALQQRVETHLPGFTLVLDFIHVSEYLWTAANRLFGEKSPRRNSWVEEQAGLLLSGHTSQVIAQLRTLLQKPKQTKARQEALTAAINYFQRNQPYMHYDRYLAQGWPIASGVIEGACRHFVKDRCELSGMRWTQQGAEHLLRLRAVAENGDWDDFHRFRREQRHLRLYGVPLPNPPEPEQQALAPPDSDKIVRFDQAKRSAPNHRNPDQLAWAA